MSVPSLRSSIRVRPAGTDDAIWYPYSRALSSRRTGRARQPKPVPPRTATRPSAALRRERPANRTEAVVVPPRRKLPGVVALVADERMEMVRDRWLSPSEERVRSRPTELDRGHRPHDREP